MKKHQTLEMPELVQEIELLLEDWHFTKCDRCEHYKLCKCLLQLSDIKYGLYKSNGELK
jgi:hypothetical protein